MWAPSMTSKTGSTRSTRPGGTTSSSTGFQQTQVNILYRIHKPQVTYFTKLHKPQVNILYRIPKPRVTYFTEFTNHK